MSGFFRSRRSGFSKSFSNSAADRGLWVGMRRRVGGSSVLGLILAGALVALGSWWTHVGGVEASSAETIQPEGPAGFPWHLASSEAAASDPSPPVISEFGEFVSQAPKALPPEAVQPGSDMTQPRQVRALALAEMRLGRFMAGWGYLHARDRCLMGAWVSAEMGCEQAALVLDDAAALALLEGGAGRSLPEAELVLAEWWVHEFARLRLMNLPAFAAGGATPGASQALSSDLHAAAQRARERALTVLALAARHNAEAATRLEELRSAWATLD